MEFIREEGRIYAENKDGTVLAEVIFPAISDFAVSINRTFVDNSLKGQGIAGKLVDEVIGYAKAHGKKIKPVCSFAAGWFEKHPEYTEYLFTD